MNLEIKARLERYYDENAWKHITLGEALENWSEKYKNRIALSDCESDELTYKELSEEVGFYAQGLLNQNINKGDKVLLQLPNSIEFVIISFALFKIGAIPIMAFSAHREAEIKGILEKTEAIAYIAKDKYLGFSYTEMIRKIQKEIEADLKIFILGDNEEYNNFHFLRAKNKITASNRNKENYKDIAVFLLSSGTTGISKLIPLKHCELLYVSEQLGIATGLNIDTVYLAALPIAHKFTLCCPGIIGTLIFGGKSIICKTTSPDEIIPLIENEKVTITALVPTIANMCIEFLDIDDFDISSLIAIQIGGSVLKPSSAKKIEKAFGCTLLQLYGTTEGQITCTRLNDNEFVRFHTQGKVLCKFDKAMIVDDSGIEVPDEEYGELIVRGPYTIYGYYGLEEVNKNCITEDCYFKTGDKARKLKDGNYQIVGRLKEMINRAGEKIIPSEIEEVLLQNKDIIEVQVVGVPDEILGEKIGVFILKNHKEIDLNKIRTYLKEKGLAYFKLPDLVRYVDSWPLTSVGKINKDKLRNLVL
ncbi:(2,3-dihydroxybenzoyl)adenylate synthase [Clostridium sp.]|uniref:(2,3-dihydroxybenzoyl)adenylate synthase n=1 Tax=Clostridium sp. TaxID=1506 RepID=UPI00359F68F8